MMNNKRYMNKKEIMQYLEVSQSTLQRMMRNGFPFIRYKNKGVEKVVFDIEAVKNWHNKPKSSVITNADRIRMMSDEELAGLIWLELPVHVLQQDKSLGHIKDWLQEESTIASEIEKDLHI